MSPSTLTTEHTVEELQGQTILYYDEHATEYVQRTLDVDLSHLYDRFLTHIPPGGHILDAGSGSGRDTLYFLDKGYEVTAFDASEELATLSSEITGQNTLHLRFQEIDFRNAFDGIWANASLLHVPPCEIDDVIARLCRALKAGGVLFASFKRGKEDYTEGDRYFNCYTEDSLHTLFKRHPTLERVEVWTNQDRSRDSLTWLNAIYQKTRHEQ
jgi:SAM-dependent methyltransferase